MKKFYTFFLVAMIAVMGSVNANAARWFISGGFQNWSHCNANYELKETTSGVFVLNLATAPIKTINGEFLICQGTPGVPDWNNKVGTNGQNVKPDVAYKYVNGGNNFKMDGSVTNAVITLDTNAGTLLIAGEAKENEYDTVYLIGDFGSGWSETTPTPYGMTLQEGTTNVWTGKFNLTAATTYFKMKAGANVYGTGGGDIAVELGTEYTASMSGNAFSLTKGEYTFSFTLDKNAETGVLKVSGEIEENNDEYGLVGTMNDWAIDNLIPMIKNADGVFVYTTDKLTAGTEFKIGTIGQGWEASFGAENNNDGGGNVNVTLNSPMNAWLGSNNNFVIADEITDVTITFTAVGSKGTLTVTGTEKQESIYIYYFKNANGWENVYAYAWNYAGEGLLGDYPGTEMISLGDDLYMVTSAAKLPSMQFNNGQTGDAELKTQDIIAPVNGACYTPEGEKTDTPADALDALAVPTVSGDLTITDDLKIEGKVSENDDIFTVTFSFPVEGMEIQYKITPEPTPASMDNAPARVEEGWSVATAENPTVEVPVGAGTFTAKAVLAEGVESAPVTYTYSVAKETTGVDTITVEAAEAVYFNLQGVRVENPANGVFIRVAAGKAVKVVL